MSRLFDVLYLVSLIFLSPWLVWRAVRTGRYRRDLAAKLLGKVTLEQQSPGPVAWFHGVSVGEVHLLTTLVTAFRQRHSGWQVVVSSTTETGLAEARSRFADLSVIAFPFDFSWAVKAALKRVKPDLIVLVESELWPNFLSIASSQSVPVIVVNARMSPRSFRRLQWLTGLARHFLFRHVRHFAVQASEYAERLRQLGVSGDQLTVTGSIKYDGATGDRSGARVELLKKLCGWSPENLIWVAGSTHDPEEKIILELYQRLRADFPELRLILVPRHPDRFDDVARLVASTGMDFVHRSQIQEPLSQMPAILLLDTVGELGAAWALANIGYTGGSLDGKRGGQSMIEPAGYGVPTTFGPHIWNFRDAARRLVETGGAFMVEGPEQLEQAMRKLCSDAALRHEMGQRARHLVQEQQGATARTLDVLQRFMKDQ